MERLNEIILILEELKRHYHNDSLAIYKTQLYQDIDAELASFGLSVNINGPFIMIFAKDILASKEK